MAKAVIVVDMLKGFHDTGNLANPRMASIIPKVKELLKQKMKAGWPVFFLRDCHDPDDEEFKMFPPHCIRGTQETEIVDELQPFTKRRGAAVINKTRYSGFYGTDLEQQLRLIKEVVVVGVCTDICVLYTVADLRNRGYRVTVLEDCVETFDAPGHSPSETNQWALNQMRYILGAEVKKLSEVI